MRRKDDEADVSLLWERIKTYPIYEAKIRKDTLKLEEVREKIEDLRSVPAVQYDKQRSQNSLKQNEIIEILVSEEMRIELEIEVSKANIASINTIVDLIECGSEKETNRVKSMITYKMIQNHTWHETKKLFNKDPKGIENDIRKALKKLVV